ncbi:MAG TPA: hypothetical protein VKT28_11900 [Puia sp.]|nr:hypothetical protein [Puia sp.]
MKFIPFDSLTIDSNLHDEEIVAVLSKTITPFKWYDNARDTDKLFYGKIDKNGFTIWQIIKKGRNSFIPIVKGKIESIASGSQIKVTMRLHIAVLIFLLFFISVIAYGFFRQKSIVALIMILGAYFMTIYFFNLESNKVKSILTSILQNGTAQVN